MTFPANQPAIKPTTIQEIKPIPIVIFIVRIPISLDGLGIQEGLYVALFAYAGLSASESFLLSLVGRVVTLVGMLPGAFQKLGRVS